MKKVGIWCAFLALFLSFFALLVCAESADNAEIATESEQALPYWQSFLSAIPEEVAVLLPEGFFSEDLTQVGAATEEASGWQTVLAVIGRLTGLSLRENLLLLARICGVLLISAIFRALCKSFEASGGMARALALCGSFSLTVLLFSLQRVRFSEISAFFSAMKALATAAIPMMGALYAMGGDVGAAVANHGVMSLFLTVLETVVSASALPVAGICMALSLSDAIAGGAQLRSLGGLIKRTYTLLFSFLMVLLCGVLGVQSTLAKGSDTLALRTVRFAAGSFLPVVGGSVSEALRTVSGSVQYLRSVTGTGAIVVLCFLFLPVFLPVLLNRVTFMLGGAVAKLLGCDGEERILTELASVYGYFLSVIASLFAMVVFSLTLFARCATAGG